MAVLAIDTSAGQCAVAVLAGDAVVRRIEKLARGHAETLFPLIDEALSEAALSYADIARIVCCTGPGSFVGTRIAVAAARGLALGIGCPAVGISRFEVLAAEARGDRHAEVGVLLAGRCGTALFQSFDRTGRPSDDPRIVSVDEPGPGLLDGLELLAGDGALDWAHLPRCLRDGLPDPAVLARLGARREPGAPPAPLYLRPPAADPPRVAPPRLLD